MSVALRSLAPVRWYWVTLSCLVALIAAPVPPAWAQAGASSTIQGTVVDESGATMPGVTVTAQSPALQVRQLTVVSGSDGRYRIPALPPGVYVLRYELSGFRTVERQDVRLSSGFIATINVEMQLGAVEETLTISGRAPIVDVTTTAGQTNFTTEMLEAAPITRTMSQILAMTPGVRMAGAPDVGGNTTGQDLGYRTYGVAGQNTPTIEGINTREGQSNTGFFYDYSAFEEVHVRALGHEAEVATAGTNFVGIVKSGGNTFHGRYRAAGQTEKLQGDNIDDALRAQGVLRGDELEYFYDVSGDLGGRIIRDRLWFYGGLLAQTVSRGIIGYSKDPGPDGVYGTADDVPGNYFIDSITNQTAKVTHQVTSHNQLIGFFQRNVRATPEREASPFRPFENTWDYTFIPMVVKGELKSTPSDNLLVNLVGGYVWYWANRPAQEGVDRPGNPARFDLSTQMRGGPHESIFFRFRRHWQSTGSVTYLPDGEFGGKHDLKVGYNVNLEHLGIDRPNRASGNYQLIYDNGVPLQIRTYNLPIEGHGTRQDNIGMYIQDRWRVGNRLTMNLGLRFDRYHNYVDEVTKPQGQFGTAGVFPAVDVQTWTALAPRLGMAFDVTGNARTVVKAAFGRFNHNPSVDFADRYNASSLTETVYRWHAPVGTTDLGPGQVNFALDGPDFISTTGASNVLLNPDLSQPVTDEFSVSLEREVASNFSLRTVYVDKVLRNLFQNSVNVLRPFDAYDVPVVRRDPGPDGVLGTADDGEWITLYDYNPAYRGAGFVGLMPLNRPSGRDDRYRTIEVSGMMRQFHNVNVVATAAATKNRRWLVDVVQRPDDERHSLDSTWQWHTKLSLSYAAPYGIQLGTFYTGQSGEPDQRTYVFRQMPQSGTLTVRLEPYGERRLPAIHSVNQRIGKRFSLGQYRLDAAVEVFNLFNVNTARNMTFVSGPTFGRVTSIMPPRVLRLAGTLSF